MPSEVSMMFGRVRLKTIALPVEHGGWGFLFEPILLGLCVAPSAAGFFLSVLTVASFLLRHPLKIFLAGEDAVSESPRRRAALQIAVVYFMIGVVGLVCGVWLGGYAPLVPFVVLAPLVVTYFFYDTQRQGRKLAAETAGPVGLGGVTTAIAVAGGWGWLDAVLLWIVLMGRTLPSIFYVRARLRLEKGEVVSRWPTVSIHLGFGVALAVFSWKDLVPYLTVVAVLVLLLRAAHGLSSRRRSSKATRIGFLEIGYGIVYVVVAIVGYRVGW
ncbi:MAG: YwiC-like family protein [Candidatus Latescibacterota bacterium]|nr:MAG: YwiC-like family protein [Candidatus Latescibacterota bacterium]